MSMIIPFFSASAGKDLSNFSDIAQRCRILKMRHAELLFSSLFESSRSLQFS